MSSYFSDTRTAKQKLAQSRWMLKGRIASVVSTINQINGGPNLTETEKNTINEASILLQKVVQNFTEGNKTLGLKK